MFILVKMSKTPCSVHHMLLTDHKNSPGGHLRQYRAVQYQSARLGQGPAGSADGVGGDKVLELPLPQPLSVDLLRVYSRARFLLAQHISRSRY